MPNNNNEKKKNRILYGLIRVHTRGRYALPDIVIMKKKININYIFVRFRGFEEIQKKNIYIMKIHVEKLL